ncbi:M3 family metallopeptidase [Agromyces endophyticus]|uniref:M3 family metallopeptidase n=1 Tax=Agromyces sp. H17E-10 TaxID=2932244 RepID=UPI001FD56AFA|nr:M3 family metallopeptidase [Agromyces sp. H17E-10]UOQ89073.1 M3 family metallopeptidase [Agromyces sp. H17E-10]
MTEPRRNPLLEPSPLPYRLPLFALITPDDYREAIEAGMGEQRAELDRIAGETGPATFENSVLALERSGATLRRVLPVFENHSSGDADEAIDAIEAEFAPRLAAHRDALLLEPRLFARLDELVARLDSGDLALEPDAAYLLRRRHRTAVLAGAGLDDAGRAELESLGGRIARLTTAFQQALLADSNDRALHLTDEHDLDGLDERRRAAARAAAEARGVDGWLIPLVLPTQQPALAELASPSARDRLLAASLGRGISGGRHDTRATLVQLVAARAERARLLGFADHATAVTADETAGSPEAVAELLLRLVPPAVANARREAAALAERASRAGGRELEASDWMHLAERERTERHEVDLSAMRPYLEADRVLHNGVFHAATLLYGLRFAERADLVGHHPDARIFEVREADGSPVGLYLLDLYARPSKRGGAWMSSLVDQSDLTGDLPVVVNHLNVPKPAAGDATLLTFDEAETLFHEFGHALHGLLARVRFPSFAGTNVFRDFVELPSQVNELWMLRPEILEHYAVHHETGEPLPHEYVERLLASRTFGEGFATTEYLAAAVLDQAWHRLDAVAAAALSPEDVARFEHEALDAVGLADPLVPPRYSSGYFAHVFAGGYDAGYYSYVWSEVPGADIMAWFEERGGATAENGARYRAEILAPGGSRDPGESIRALLGREPRIDALLARRGLG